MSFVPGDSATVRYAMLGVQATNLGTGAMQFQTSLQGDFLLAPGATTGKEDGIVIERPGPYRLALAVCFSSVSACLAGMGWEVLTATVDVQVAIDSNS